MSFVLGGLSESAHTDTAKPFESHRFFYTSKNDIKTILIVAAATGSISRGRIRRALACRDPSKNN
jgi:hypothetical protein